MIWGTAYPSLNFTEPAMRMLLLLVALAAPALAQEPSTALSFDRPWNHQDKLHALIVSGQNNHDCEWTTEKMQRVLEDSGRFEVRTTGDPEQYLASSPRITEVDVFVLDYNGPRWGEDAEQRFLEAVSAGAGVVVVHAANNAFKGWTDYETLVGHLWREGTSHGRFHTFDVPIARRDHPVTATLPDIRDHPDELYHDLWRAPAANHETLASAMSSKESGGSGKEEPMILVGSFGKGRIFHTPLGHVWRDQEHTRASFEDPQLHTLLVRGAEWAATGAVSDGLTAPNHLSAAEAADGWRLLFDGVTTEGLRGWNKPGFPDKGWEIVNGCLRRAASGGGDLITTGVYENFELAFEWKTARGVNSGVKYRVPEVQGYTAGPEYQILDDPGTNEDNNPLSAAAAMYHLFAPAGKTLAPTGSFNHSRIVARGKHLEHWLNGVKVLEADVDGEAWNAAKARSKFKDMDGYGDRPGHILFQDHGGEAWYRSIKLRELEVEPARGLLSGSGLAGWKVVGAAEYRREEGDIVGSVPEGGLRGNAFLRTEEEFTNFVFDVELKVEVPGNSGIQFRSRQRDGDGVVYGYQAEIDCSARRWSGGIYGESFTGWLDDLKDDPAGQAAFRVKEWNHFRVQAIGNHLQVWVNGVQTANLVNDEIASGFLALQVHGGGQGSFRWRNPRIRVLD